MESDGKGITPARIKAFGLCHNKGMLPIVEGIFW